MISSEETKKRPSVSKKRKNRLDKSPDYFLKYLHNVWRNCVNPVVCHTFFYCKNVRD